MVFYCTRCGARLQAPDDVTTSTRVRCGTCAGVTRTPEPADDLPVAFPAEPVPLDRLIDPDQAPDR